MPPWPVSDARFPGSGASRGPGRLQSVCHERRFVRFQNHSVSKRRPHAHLLSPGSCKCPRSRSFRQVAGAPEHPWNPGVGQGSECTGSPETGFHLLPRRARAWAALFLEPGTASLRPALGRCFCFPAAACNYPSPGCECPECGEATRTGEPCTRQRPRRPSRRSCLATSASRQRVRGGRRVCRGAQESGGAVGAWV